MFRSFYIVFLFLLASCSEHGESYYSKRSESVKAELVQELESVSNLRDLFERQERLSVLFERLASLSIEAMKVPGSCSWSMSPEALESSRRLAQEFTRVLQIPGAQALLEHCQVEGLEKIDAFESSVMKESEIQTGS